MMRCKTPRLIIMMAGPQGSGRSALLNNMVRKCIVEHKGSSEINIYVIGKEDEKSQRLMTYIETPGFGIGSNEEAVYDSILEYLREQLDSYIEEESKIRRNPHYEDTRVQCLIYTIPATGNGLKQRDVAFLKKVSGLVNIIPVITKSDILSSSELESLKYLLADQLEYFKIKVFKGPFDTSATQNEPESLFPFSVICSDKLTSRDRVRDHIAGLIDVENPMLSDLQMLRETILKTYADELAERTAIDIYENYRAEALESVMNGKSDEY